MNKKAILIVILLLSAGVLSAFKIQPVEASGTIYIRADGSIDPPTAPIQRNGDTYTFTGNITSDSNGVVVEKNNIIVNGAGHWIIGPGYIPNSGLLLQNTSGVVVCGINFKSFCEDIRLNYSSGNTISDCTMSNEGLPVDQEYLGIELICSYGNSMYGNNIIQKYIYVSNGANNIIRNNNITSSLPLFATVGIYIYESSSNVISENNILNKTWYSVYSYRSSGNIISRNSLVGGSVCIHYLSSDNRVIENDIRLAYGYDFPGVFLYSSCSDNIIINNNMTSCDYAVHIRQGCSNNIIAGNNIMDNAHGVLLSESYGNYIVNNNIVNNTQQASTNGWDYENYWDDASSGNFWSDYNGTDVNPHDGIGDTPYTIYTNNIDRYPSMHPFSGFRWVWGDDDNDGILNYLDSGIFSFDESNAPSAKVFESVNMPIKITHLKPSSDYGQMMATLHEWGVKETSAKTWNYAFIIDVSDVYGVLSWLRVEASGLISEDFFNKAHSCLCADGHWRSLWILRFDLDVPQILKAIVELEKFLFDPSDPPHWDVLFQAITRLINLCGLEIYTLRGVGSVTASLSFDFAHISWELAGMRKYILELFISACTIIGIILNGIACGSFAGVAFLLGAKLINYILDYFILDYVKSDFLDWIKVALRAIDPPEDRVILQLFDASGETMLIGHDQTLDEDICTFEHGIYSADNDSAILLVSRTGLNYNLTVTTTPTTATPMPYTMITWDCTQNNTVLTGGVLDVDQAFSTHLNLTNDTLDMSYLSLNATLSNLNPQIGEQVKVSVNVTDDDGMPQGDCDVALSIAGETITAQNQGGGLYNATIDTSAMAGLYNLTIFTRTAPPGFLQGVAIYPLEVGPHDVAVIDLHHMKTGCAPVPTVCLFLPMKVYVTVWNQGNFPETFNVTVYVNSTKFDRQTAVLEKGTSAELTFVWLHSFSINTYQWYEFSVVVSQVSNETDLSDNTFVDGGVLVTHMGDITGDGKVDIQDVARVTGAFGTIRVSNSSDPQYGKYRHPTSCRTCPHEPNTDVTGDGKVDIQDLARTSGNFGWHR